MKEIQTSRGKVAIVDDDKFEYLSQFKWYCTKFGYIQTTQIVDGKKTNLWMHRMVANTPPGMKTDHINGDKQLNTIENLRTCTTAENMRNRSMQKNNTSGYKGVFWSIRGKKWRAQITVNKKAIHLGLFDDPKEAYEAYKLAADAYFGDFVQQEAAMNERKIKIVFRTYGNREYREERVLAEIPKPGDEVQFEDGEVFRVSGRTFVTDTLGETICDIYLDKPESIHA